MEYNPVAPPNLWTTMPRPPLTCDKEDLIFIMCMMRVEIIRLYETLKKANIEVVISAETDPLLSAARMELAATMIKMLAKMKAESSEQISEESAALLAKLMARGPNE
jgi:hypothetical protein